MPVNAPWVVIPAQNEEGSIAMVVAGARRFADKVVVVDDASTDDTLRKAKSAGAYVLPLASSLGAWGATQTGLVYAGQQGATCVVSLDADGQHPTQNLWELCAPILRGEADVVIGSDPARVSLQRRMAWVYLRQLTGLPVEDLTSGFRAYGADAIEVLSTPEASLLNYQDIGVLMLLRHYGLRLAEVPVGMSPRMSGASRVFSSWFRVLGYLVESTIVGFAHRRNPMRQSSGRTLKKGR